MTAIASPQPRRPSRKQSQSPAQPPLYLTDMAPRVPCIPSSGFNNPPRLLSPIRLGDPLNYLSKSSPSCSPKRRRSHVGVSSRSARRRHPSRTDCALNYATGPSVFDSLSWISQLQEAPECVDIWDIADLSLLPIEQSSPSSSVGPVRSRKSSLRSNPLASPSASSQLDRISKRPQPIPLLPLLDREALDTRTPPPSEKFDSNDIIFHELLPALPVYDRNR
ncbi:hypothetical protein BXZ70DRAFT_278322 [Cristinia sonorae]|uniref:Uncharacterized protein n=1 Tax=Cristinia sonorae TaxID=1940300 RepID=A0A8K0XV32_9AGAR|nr:hypothetical protein BXZ70DRAFT_278322 [Cristinia sonorae]